MSDRIERDQCGVCGTSWTAMGHIGCPRCQDMDAVERILGKAYLRVHNARREWAAHRHDGDEGAAYLHDNKVHAETELRRLMSQVDRRLTTTP